MSKEPRVFVCEKCYSNNCSVEFKDDYPQVMGDRFSEDIVIREVFKCNCKICGYRWQEFVNEEPVVTKDKVKQMRVVLKHILDEQLAHGDHGDSEYIRMIRDLGIE